MALLDFAVQIFPLARTDALDEILIRRGIQIVGREVEDGPIAILEIKPDFGCDGGLFLRSSEKGEAC